MSKNKVNLRFSNEEISILVDCIKINPNNIKKACEMASDKIKRTLKVNRPVSSLINKYQTTIRKVPTKSTDNKKVESIKSYSPKYKLVLNMVNSLSTQDKERLVMETFKTL